MSNFTQKKPQIGNVFAACAIVATTALVGCTKSDDKKVEKKTETTKTETTTTTTAPLDCASPTAVSSIQQALTNQIAQQASNTVKQLGQQAGLDVANLTMDATMSQLMVNVQNSKAVAGQADQCQGMVSITLPETDVANANQLAASLNQPTLVQRLNGKGLTLENNTVIAQNVAFKLAQAGSNYTTTPVSADNIINEVSNVLANSQLKQMMVQSKAITPAAAATGAMAGAATSTVVTRHYTQPKATVTHDKPKTPVVTKPAAKPVVKADTSAPKANTEKPSTQTLTDSSSKTITNKSTTTAPAVQATKTTTTTEKTTTTKIQAVPNDNTKLTIEEKNEKY